MDPKITNLYSRDDSLAIPSLKLLDEYMTRLTNWPRSSLPECTEDGIPVRKLFIGNLAERTTNKDLEKFFSTYGKIESCYLKRNNNKSNFAFVTFADSADALEAREAAEGIPLQLHCRFLRVSPADSWHQPDSPENQRKFFSNKANSGEELPVEEQSKDEAPISMLNDDCLMEIFLRLPIADRIRMERVCKRWRAVSLESWRAVKRLDLSFGSWGLTDRIRKRPVDTPALRKVLLRCGSFLNHIDFSDTHVLGPSALTIVGKFCPNLRNVNISNIKMSPAGINSLQQNCSNITKLSMKGMTGAACENNLSQLFAANKKLKYLKITDGALMCGKCLLHLPCETMEELHIYNGFETMTIHLDAVLLRSETLRKLTISGCVALRTSTFSAISKIKTLTSLMLCGHFSLGSAEDLQQLTELENLESLTIKKNDCVNDMFLHHLAERCKRLTYLNIEGSTAVTDDGLASISTISNLQHLVTNFIRKASGKYLPQMRNLRTLECHYCTNFNDAEISSLVREASELQFLDLTGCHITNSTIEVAIKATRRRSNNTILKMIIGNTLTNLSEITEVSPLLQIVNINLVRPEFSILDFHWNEIFIGLP